MNSTLIAYVRSGAINTYVLTDNQTTPASASFSLISVANVAGDAGTLDVYLVSPGVSLNGVAPVFSGMGSKTTSAAKAITSGTYDIVVTASGKPNDVRLSMPSVAFASTDIVTVALTAAHKRRSACRRCIDQARRRYATQTQYAGSWHELQVRSPSSGSSKQFDCIGRNRQRLARRAHRAPSLSAYKLIPGGVSTYTVSVDGIAIASFKAAAVPSSMVATYTILVSGTPAAPVVKVITDNNQPSISGYAKYSQR